MEENDPMGVVFLEQFRQVKKSRRNPSLKIMFFQIFLLICWSKLHHVEFLLEVCESCIEAYGLWSFSQECIFPTSNSAHGGTWSKSAHWEPSLLWGAIAIDLSTRYPREECVVILVIQVDTSHPSHHRTSSMLWRSCSRTLVQWTVGCNVMRSKIWTCTSASRLKLCSIFTSWKQHLGSVYPTGPKTSTTSKCANHFWSFLIQVESTFTSFAHVHLIDFRRCQKFFEWTYSR